MSDSSVFHSGFVTIVGRPNVGKSTLLNALIGEKIAIISNRPQTTRNQITGILTKEDSQLIFVDTPGYHNPRTRLGQYMVQSIQDAMDGMDLLLVLTDVTHISEQDTELIEKLGKRDVRKLLLLNKCDLMAPKDILKPIARFQNAGYDEIYPISARTGDGLDKLMEDIYAHLPVGPRYFPDDSITNQTERQLAAELIREKALRNLRDEVPHGVGVEITQFTEGDNLITIYANIFCERESHKNILIGKNGAMIKTIGTQARQDLEGILGTHINLQLWVKVRPDWRNNSADLKMLGYYNEK